MDPEIGDLIGEVDVLFQSHSSMSPDIVETIPPKQSSALCRTMVVTSWEKAARKTRGAGDADAGAGGVVCAGIFLGLPLPLHRLLLLLLIPDYTDFHVICHVNGLKIL